MLVEVSVHRNIGKAHSLLAQITRLQVERLKVDPCEVTEARDKIGTGARLTDSWLNNSREDQCIRALTICWMLFHLSQAVENIANLSPNSTQDKLLAATLTRVCYNWTQG